MIGKILFTNTQARAFKFESSGKYCCKILPICYHYAFQKFGADKLITLHQNNPSLGMNKKHWFNLNILRGVPFQTLEKMINLGLLFEISIFSI